MSQQNDVEAESKKLEKKIKKEFEKLSVLQSIQDISQKFNKCQYEILKYVFKNYIEGKKEITFQEFKNSIIAKRRPQLKQDKHPDDAKLYNGTATDEEVAKYKNRCRFIILHKNKLVQCRHPIHPGENDDTFSNTKPYQHLDSDSEKDSEEDSEEESTSNELNNNYINNTCLCAKHKGQNNVLASEFVYPKFD